MLPDATDTLICVSKGWDSASLKDNPLLPIAMPLSGEVRVGKGFITKSRRTCSTNGLRRV